MSHNVSYGAGANSLAFSGTSQNVTAVTGTEEQIAAFAPNNAYSDIFVEKSMSELGLTACGGATCYVGCTCNTDNEWYSSTSNTGANYVAAKTRRVYAYNNGVEQSSAQEVTCYHKKSECDEDNGYFLYDDWVNQFDSNVYQYQQQEGKPNCYKPTCYGYYVTGYDEYGDLTQLNFFRQYATTPCTDCGSRQGEAQTSDPIAPANDVKCYKQKWPSHFVVNLYKTTESHQSRDGIMRDYECFGVNGISLYAEDDDNGTRDVTNQYTFVHGTSDGGSCSNAYSEYLCQNGDYFVGTSMYVRLQDTLYNTGGNFGIAKEGSAVWSQEHVDVINNQCVGGPQHSLYEVGNECSSRDPHCHDIQDINSFPAGNSLQTKWDAQVDYIYDQHFDINNGDIRIRPDKTFYCVLKTSSYASDVVWEHPAYLCQGGGCLHEAGDTVAFYHKVSSSFAFDGASGCHVEFIDGNFNPNVEPVDPDHPDINELETYQISTQQINKVGHKVQTFVGNDTCENHGLYSSEPSDSFCEDTNISYSGTRCLKCANIAQVNFSYDADTKMLCGRYRIGSYYDGTFHDLSGTYHIDQLSPDIVWQIKLGDDYYAIDGCLDQGWVDDGNQSGKITVFCPLDGAPSGTASDITEQYMGWIPMESIDEDGDPDARSPQGATVLNSNLMLSCCTPVMYFDPMSTTQLSYRVGCWKGENTEPGYMPSPMGTTDIIVSTINDNFITKIGHKKYASTTNLVHVTGHWDHGNAWDGTGFLTGTGGTNGTFDNLPTCAKVCRIANGDYDFNACSATTNKFALSDQTIRVETNNAGILYLPVALRVEQPDSSCR